MSSTAAAYQLLNINEIRLNGREDTNMLDAPLPVTKIIRTHTITPSDQVVSMHANILRISGYGLAGACRLSLYFDPPLYYQVAYEIDGGYPLLSDTITLRLRAGYSWRPTVGDLHLVGVDTGAGPVRLNGLGPGVKVATIVLSTAPTGTALSVLPDATNVSA
jgi:hypothetical protein